MSPIGYVLVIKDANDKEVVRSGSSGETYDNPAMDIEAAIKKMSEYSIKEGLKAIIISTDCNFVEDFNAPRPLKER